MKLFIALAGLLLALSAAAESTAPRAVVKLVSGNGYQPYADQSLSNGGMITDLVRRVFAEMGQSVTVDFIAWETGFEMTRQGQFQATFPYILTTEREQDFFYSGSLNKAVNRLFVAQGADLNYQSAADLNGKTACNIIGSAHPQVIEDMINQGTVTLIKTKTLADCFSLIQTGKADFISINELNGWNTIVNNFKSRMVFKMVGPAVEVSDQYLIVSRHLPGAQQLISSFNQTLRKLQQSGELDRIRQKHMQVFTTRAFR